MFARVSVNIENKNSDSNLTEFNGVTKFDEAHLIVCKTFSRIFAHKHLTV